MLKRPSPSSLHSLLPGLGIGLACSCLMLILWQSGWLAPLDRYMQDGMFRRRGERPAEARIVLVVLDKATIARYRTSPLPRSVYAEVIRKVAAGGAHTIALNYLFDVPGDKAGDKALAKACWDAGNVITGYTFDAASSSPVKVLPQKEELDASPDARAVKAFSIAAPIPEIAESVAGFGFLNIRAEEDGAWKSIPNVMQLVREEQPSVAMPSLALATAIHALGSTPYNTRFEPGSIEIDGALEEWRSVPINQSGETPINWLGSRNAFQGRGVFPYYNFLRVLDGRLPPGTFRNAIVLIGQSTQGSFTPITTPFRGTQMDLQTDLEMQANAVDDILSNRLLHDAGWPLWSLYLFLPSLTLGAIAASRGTVQAVGFLAVWTLFLWLTGLWFFRSENIYLSLAAPQLALLASSTVAISYRQIYDSRDARRVTQIFGAYVGEEVLRQLAGRPPEMRGEVRPVAVLFCDIRGFSTLAEQMQDDPALLLSLLNDHFDPLTEILKSRGAFVDKFVGDMMMGVFGAPLPDESEAASARNAVLSAIEVLTTVERRNRERQALGQPLIEVGIGVHCGPAIVGNLGSRSRMNYTAIGDTVNIGSRVEDATRVYDIPLLVTEEVMQACESDSETRNLRWKFVDETIVRNRRQPVRLYTVRRESILERQVQTLEKKNAARVLRRRSEELGNL